MKRLCTPAPTGPAAQTPDGGVVPHIVKRPGSGRHGLSCWLALPPRISSSRPPLVAIHGIRRGARSQARAFAARAAAEGRPVIAPLFGKSAWPRYQQVVRGERADLALLGLMDELRLAGIWRARQFTLAGYSGGAQFAHRFALLYPHLIERLTVTAAGWYTMPDAAAFPYGFGARRPGDEWGARLGAGLDGLLRLPVNVCVGANDAADENTRQRPELDAQGPDRLARATSWIDALGAAAERRGLPCRARLHVLKGCGHDFRECIRRGGLAAIALPDETAAPVLMAAE